MWGRIMRTRAQFQNLNVLRGPAYEIPVVVHAIAPSNSPTGWVKPTDQQTIDAIDRLSADLRQPVTVVWDANLPLENPGFQNMPAHRMEGMMIIASQMVSSTSTTLTHELEHAFGLYHTFEGGDQTNCPPMTDGTNCTTIGDKVCDTDPVKNLLHGGPALYSTLILIPATITTLQWYTREYYGL
ncbi:M43 family zinc metalloprotease [Niabella yanshanensis]|uniref:M43 family zinc metalloprotease n=1 Tax=Niabella yanshanensis TaxID=577386 RepID=A0ABZ0W3N7_9BACT|nr:M43 family zinc metalloprotease [Niabella yanshanensis]WQD36625.1 M43 family zinc metalloprotease [Niabella yanshanensis]